jgi:hypothetical protein
LSKADLHAALEQIMRNTAGSNALLSALIRRRLFTAGFDGWDFREVGRQLVCGKGFHVQFHQADKGTTKIRFGLAAPVENDADCGNNPAVPTNDVDCFLDASTARYDIFSNDEFFIRRNLKTASQNKFAIFFFDEDVAFAQRATDFLADNNSAKGRGDHRVAIKFAEFVGEPSTDFCSDVRVLKEYRALKILPAVQAGPQDEMAIEQSPGLAE